MRSLLQAKSRNHHGNKRNASNLNNDRRVGRVALPHCPSPGLGEADRSPQCPSPRLDERVKGRRRPILSGTSPAFKLCSESNRLQVGFFLTEYVAYLLTVASRGRSPRRRYDRLLGELFTLHV